MRSGTINIDDFYVPTPKQLLFHQCADDEALYGGAAGGGKSHSIVADSFLVAIQFKGVDVYLFRRTYPELEDTLIKIARAMIPKTLATYSTNRHEMEMVNGSMLRFRHCNTMDDVYRYQGAEMNALYIDELTHFEKEMVDYLLTRLRANVALKIRPFARYGSNPGGIGHAWVKAKFVDPHPTGGSHIEEITTEINGKKMTQRKSIGYIPATVRDNPHISQGYIFELARKPKALRDSLLDGKWDAFEGQVFIEWVNAPDRQQAVNADIRRPAGTHVVHPFEVPTWWPIWMSYDHGYEKPFSAGWWAIDQEHDTVYRVGEWYGSGGGNVGIKLQIDEIAKGIKDIEAGRFPRAYIKRVGDPHLWDEDGGESIGRAFQRNGIHFSKGDNTRFAGKMQIHYRLRMREDERPRLYVFSTCRDFIRTIPALSYNPKATAKRAEDIDTDSEDHTFDETRYFLMEFKIAAPEPQEEDRTMLARVNPLDSNRRAAGGRYVPRG